MPTQVLVQLPKGRMKEGKMTIVNGATRADYRCLGRSDASAAAGVGNPERNPLKPYGDLPTGTYDAVVTVAAEQTPANKRAYGPGVRWVLNPLSGEALKAKQNGRWGLLIHGGATGSPMPPNALRPTHGCLRVDNSTIDELAKLPKAFLVTVTEV